MKRYVLDTNVACHLLRGHPQVSARVQTIPMAALRMQAVLVSNDQVFGMVEDLEMEDWTVKFDSEL